MKFSKLTDYAVIILTALQHSSIDNSASASAIAKETMIPEPTVSKVLKILARANLVISQRGASGGYYISRDLSQISVLDALIAVEGPLTMTECSSDSDNVCSLESICSLNGRWNIVNLAIEDTLKGISLQQLRKAPAPKSEPNLNVNTLELKEGQG